MSVSVIILTKNEEVNLPYCLESVKWSDDIVVLDDGSTDKTVEIAHQAGARVIRHSAGGEDEQRTYSLREISFKYSWVYNPDADEITTEELKNEILGVVAETTRSEVAYRVRFKTIFMGRWIRHSSLYPTWVMRLFRPEKIKFERSINLNYVADGPIGFLHSHFLHRSFNKGFDAWFEKHNRYSHDEAREALSLVGSKSIRWRDLLVFDPVIRRQALKEFSFRLPFRPTLRFYYMYIIRRGFLDGWPGFVYCRLLSIYEYMTVLKMKEIQRREMGLPV